VYKRQILPFAARVPGYFRLFRRSATLGQCREPNGVVLLRSLYATIKPA
jgi:hypothetical protein